MKIVKMIKRKILLNCILGLIIFFVVRYTRTNDAFISTIRTSLQNYLQQKFNSERPNLLIFYVDDWGWGDLGINVGKDARHSETPIMDEFARNGIRFTDFHVASSICTPSRASLLTGRLGLRNGINGLLGPSNVAGLSTNEVTISEYLKKENYSTFAIGKWHLGHTEQFHPNDRGFDRYFGVPYSIDQGCLDYPGYIYPVRLDCSKETTTAFGALPLMKDKKIIEQPLDIRRLSKQYEMEFRERMVEIKENNVNFFGYVPFSKVHVPLGFSASFENTTSSVYGDNLKELDYTFGQMMSTLKDLDLLENTIVWLAGDNGPWQCECQYGGSTGPFQGTWQRRHGGGGATGKLTIWEGGHRVPGVVSWPKYIRSGRVSDALVSSMDILPTMASLIGFPLSEDREYDGTDISNILTGKSDQGHEVLFHPRSDGWTGEITAIRYKNYKAIFKSGGKRLLDCAQNIGPLKTHDPPLMFDLRTDVSEEFPLKTSDPEYKTTLRKILKLLEEKNANIEKDMRSEFNDKISDNVMPCCNPNNRHCRC